MRNAKGRHLRVSIATRGGSEGTAGLHPAERSYSSANRTRRMLGGVRAAAAIFVALAVAACNGPVKRPDGGVGLMPIGEHAPDIEGLDGSGKEVKLSDLRGSLAVVYFYPADGSPGCTK